MLVIANRAAVSAALDDPQLDVDVRALVGRRAWKLYVEENRPQRDDVKFVVVEGGDAPNAINKALGFAVAGDCPEVPSYKSIEDHGLWFEVAYARADNPCTFVLVENGPGTELSIHWMCLAYFWRDGDLEF